MNNSGNDIQDAGRTQMEQHPGHARKAYKKQPSDLTDSSSRAGSRSAGSKTGSMTVSVSPEMLSVLENMRDEEVGETEEDLQQMKKAGRCCGCGCDLIRACMITNTVYIGIMTILLIAAFLDLPFYNRFALNKDPDAPEGVIDTAGVLALVRTGLGICFAILGIFGAYLFSSVMVLISGIGYCIYIIWSLVSLRLVGAVLAAAMAYPNFHLFYVLHKGIITKENYVHHKYCCGDSSKDDRK